MPTLEDCPTIPKLTGANVQLTDLVQIYDVSAQRPKAITIAELIVALDALDEGALAEDA